MALVQREGQRGESIERRKREVAATGVGSVGRGGGGGGGGRGGGNNNDPDVAVPQKG